MVKDRLRQQHANALEKKLKKGTKPEPNGPASPPLDVDSMVFGYKADLCNREDVYRVAEVVKREVGTVDLLVNNAGVVSGKDFLSTSDEQNLLTMNVNAICHFWVR
jgi:NAD(P)-dependent dehydrogenase (short-subunit alcohol dehydrogenase family)